MSSISMLVPLPQPLLAACCTTSCPQAPAQQGKCMQWVQLRIKGQSKPSATCPCTVTCEQAVQILPTNKNSRPLVEPALQYESVVLQ